MSEPRAYFVKMTAEGLRWVEIDVNESRKVNGGVVLPMPVVEQDNRDIVSRIDEALR